MAEQINSGISEHGFKYQFFRESDFETNFDPHGYLATMSLQENGASKYANLVTSLAEMYHEIFSRHEPGERLLDIGSGPTLWHLMSASAKYKSITISDPVAENRLIHEQYISDVNQDHRWTAHFKLTAKLEGNIAKWSMVQERLRASVNRVIRCDILQDHPLGSDQDQELYDCVFSSLVLDAVCRDVPSFTKAVKNLISLAKPGAPVVFGDVLGATYCDVGTCKYACLTLTPELVRTCVEDIGCKVIKFHVRRITHSDDATDFDGIFVMEVCKQ